VSRSTEGQWSSFSISYDLIDHLRDHTSVACEDYG
jgi:hypothetical protein